MAIWPFRRRRADVDADRLLAAVIEASRKPAFYGAGGVPDTLEGRFELMTLNATLALMRLRAAPEAEPLAQAFTDRLFRHLDAGLRESGVSDMAVPKRMQNLAGSFYGRLEAYAAALEAGDRAGLDAAIVRNIQAQAPAAIAGYALAAYSRQAAQPIERLAEPAAWAPVE